MSSAPAFCAREPCHVCHRSVSIQHSAALWAFLLSVVFGAVAQRSNYCTMGAISDVTNFGDWTRAHGAGLGGCSHHRCRLAQVVRHGGHGQIVLRGAKLIWLSHIVGGLTFGFGMTLASGCGSKTLLRVGAGSLRALVTLLVMGIFAWFTLRGILAVFRVATLDAVAVTLPTTRDIPSLLGLSARRRHLCRGRRCAGRLCARRPRVRADKWNWLGGLVVGLMVWPAGMSAAASAFMAEHPETLEAAWVSTNSGRPESLTFTAPPAYLLELLGFWSDKSKFVTFGIASVLGVIAGACVMALATKTFRWEGFASTEDLANHLAGAALMGFGGVLALGCTVGQGSPA